MAANERMTAAATSTKQAGRAVEVFGVALKLGLTSFGGPIAHLGYYERTYVRQRKWLTGEQYAAFISLCQLLPGPTSSQVGFLIGRHRAGWPGAFAAWLGFTLPSAVLMYAFAVLAPSGGRWMQSVLHGLMLTAVVVVAQAVWSMARTLCPDLPRRAIAIVVCLCLIFIHGELIQISTLVGGAVCGMFMCRPSLSSTQMPDQPGTRGGWIALTLFVGLLAGLPALALLAPRSLPALADIFYRSGALVFGGGHVVLPLLQQALVPAGWISNDRFLTGYGFAQAMPGPLFTLSAYLGAASAPPHHSIAWSVIALIAIFLPGMLLAVAGLSLWTRLTQLTATRAMLAGINAAVVGLLAAALYNPVWVFGVRSVIDVPIVVVGFALLQRFKTPPILIAMLCVAFSGLSAPSAA